MKAKRRHELREDELANAVNFVVTKFRDHQKEITIGTVIILVCVIITSWLNVSRRRTNEDVWQKFLEVEEALRPNAFTINRDFGLTNEKDRQKRDEVFRKWAEWRYNNLGIDIPKKKDKKDLEIWNLMLDIGNKLYEKGEKDKAVMAYQVVAVEYRTQQTETKEKASDVARRSLDFWAAEEYKFIGEKYSSTKAAPWAFLKSANKYYEVASSLKRSGDSENAKRNFENALAILKKILEDHSNDEIGLLARSSLGYVYKELGRNAEADKYFEELKDSQFASALLPMRE